MSRAIAEASAYYHGVLRQDCPWDCSRCPSNVAGDAYEQEQLAHDDFRERVERARAQAVATGRTVKL